MGVNFSLNRPSRPTTPVMYHWPEKFYYLVGKSGAVIVGLTVGPVSPKTTGLCVGGRVPSGFERIRREVWKRERIVGHGIAAVEDEYPFSGSRMLHHKRAFGRIARTFEAAHVRLAERGAGRRPVQQILALRDAGPTAAYVHQPTRSRIVAYHALVGARDTQAVSGKLRRLLPADQVATGGQADAHRVAGVVEGRCGRTFARKAPSRVKHVIHVVVLDHVRCDATHRLVEAAVAAACRHGRAQMPPVDQIIAHHVLGGFFRAGVLPGSTDLAQWCKEVTLPILPDKTMVLHVPAVWCITNRGNLPDTGARVFVRSGRGIAICRRQWICGQRRPGNPGRRGTQKTPSTNAFHSRYPIDQSTRPPFSGLAILWLVPRFVVNRDIIPCSSPSREQETGGELLVACRGPVVGQDKQLSTGLVAKPRQCKKVTDDNDLLAFNIVRGQLFCRLRFLTSSTGRF